METADNVLLDFVRSETGNLHANLRASPHVNPHVKEPCPVGRMESEGGPVSGERSRDRSPKVGPSRPADIMAITRSLSGG